MNGKNVLLRATVFMAETNTSSPERNVRSVEAIYVGDILDEPDLKVIVLQGEMWDYKALKWIPIYGELCIRLNPGQTFDAPIFIPFDELGNIQWSTNRWAKTFILGTRDI